MSFAHFHCCTFSVVSVVLFITCRWQPVSWLASHNLISTWITISCVCFLFCFHSPPLHYMFLLTLVPAVQPHLPRHPVWTCAALHLLACPSTLPIKPAAVSNLSVSSILSFLLLLFTRLQRYTQPSAPCTLSTTFISPMFTLIYGLTPSLCVRVRVQACLLAQKCLSVIVREGAAGHSTQPQPILRLSFFMIFPFDPWKPHLFTFLLCSLLSSVSLFYLKAKGTYSTSGSIEPYLSGIKTGILSGRVASPAAAFVPGLRKYPQEGAMPALTASSSQAKALLASLSASGLSAEALLLSSALRHHRLLREQRASSLPLPSSQSSSPTPTATSSSSSSPSTPTPSLSPSSPTFGSFAFSSGVLKPSRRSLDSSSLNRSKDGGNKPVKKDFYPGNKWWIGGG